MAQDHPEGIGGLTARIRDCRLCAARFSATATAHSPRPVVWFHPNARILIAGQAPGARVHVSGRPFSDASGDRLRGWLGLDQTEFYDLDRVAVVPMAFCFPGYDAKKADLAPPPVCAQTWRVQVMRQLRGLRLTVLVGAHAQRWHLGSGPRRAGGRTVRRTVRETVANWRDHAPEVFVVPHPSWRNTAWLRRNPWFETQLLPQLQARVRSVLDG